MQRKYFVLPIIAIILVSAICIGTLMNTYTTVNTKFKVMKAIVVDNEIYNSTYVLEIDFGSLYQGETISKNITVHNRASTDILVNLYCNKVSLVYKSGYTTSKTPENATAYWGINVTIKPSMITTIPAQSSVNVTILIKIEPNAQVTENSDKYDYYLAMISIDAC